MLRLHPLCESVTCKQKKIRDGRQDSGTAATRKWKSCQLSSDSSITSQEYQHYQPDIVNIIKPQEYQHYQQDIVTTLRYGVFSICMYGKSYRILLKTWSLSQPTEDV